MSGEARLSSWRELTVASLCHHWPVARGAWCVWVEVSCPGMYFPHEVGMVCALWPLPVWTLCAGQIYNARRLKTFRCGSLATWWSIDTCMDSHGSHMDVRNGIPFYGMLIIRHADRCSFLGEPWRQGTARLLYFCWGWLSMCGAILGREFLES